MIPKFINSAHRACITNIALPLLNIFHVVSKTGVDNYSLLLSRTQPGISLNMQACPVLNDIATGRMNPSLNTTQNAHILTHDLHPLVTISVIDINVNNSET